MGGAPIVGCAGRSVAIMGLAVHVMESSRTLFRLFGAALVAASCLACSGEVGETFALEPPARASDRESAPPSGRAPEEPALPTGTNRNGVGREALFAGIVEADRGEDVERDFWGLPVFVEKPEPGEHQGPWIREEFPSGAPHFESRQVQRADGTWVLNGEWTAWHANGVVQERGSYHEHREEGIWQWWDESGGRIARGVFEGGVREGPWTYWHADGTKKLDGLYSRGKGEGHWILYHESGLKCAEGDFVGGEISGRWTVWREDGSIDPERSGLYRGGKRVAE